MAKQFRLTLLAVLSLALVVAAACYPPAAPVPPSVPAPSSSITNIVWQWTSVANRTTGRTTTVPNPTAYTIIFRDDGTVSGQADCNTFTGTYSTDGGLFINTTPDVMAACGGASLDIQYFELLDAIVTGGPDGSGGLALETAGGEQRMTFVSGVPPAPTAPAAAPAPSSDITNIVWKWQTLEDVAAGASTRVPDPSKYTIVFYDDGTTTGQADCNTFSGTYSQGADFTISVTPDVMAACDQGSMDQQFLNLLDEVVAGGSDGAGGLMLQTAGGAQKLLFSNGGAAQ